MAAEVPKLRTTAEGRANLARYCSDAIGDWEQVWRTDFEDQALWWQWYEARPQVAVKSWPWPGSSNAVMPVIRAHADSIASRLYSTIFSYANVWSGRTQNEDLRDMLLEDVKFLNWAEGEEFDLKTPVWDWINECTVIGRSTLMSEWRPTERWVLVPGDGSTKSSARRVRIDRGPNIYHVPAYQLVYPVGEDPATTSFLARQSFLSWSDIVAGAQFNGWDPEAVDKCRQAGGVTDSAGGSIHEKTLANASLSNQMGTGRREPHDIREIWADVPLEGDFQLAWEDATPPSSARFVKLRMVYHRKANKILRVEADPYGLGRNPAYHIYYRKRAGQTTGAGCAKILEGLQRSESTMFNQATDAVTLANAAPYKTDDPLLKDHVYSPSTVIYTQHNFEPIAPAKQIMPDIQMMRVAQTYGERAIGNSDPLMGRESRSGGHPSPATNYLGQQEVGKILQSPTEQRIRTQMGHIGIDFLTYYQLFDTDMDGKLIRYLGARDASKARAFFFPTDQPILGNLSLDIFATNDLESPQAKQQKALAVSQMTNNIASTVIPMLEAIFNPKVPPEMKAMIAQFIRSNFQAFEHFLEASGIDDIENYIIGMEESAQHGIGKLSDFRAALEQQIQQQPGGGPGNVPGQPGMGGPDEGPPPGAGGDSVEFGI